MTDRELTELLRSEFKAVGMSQKEAMQRSGLSASALQNFKYSRCSTTFHTFVNVAKAIGYDVKLVKNGTLVTEPMKVRPVMHKPKLYTKVRVENEYACLKCGRDAGMVTVAGHDQCAHCGHIVQDCCGD